MIEVEVKLALTDSKRVEQKLRNTPRNLLNLPKEN